MLTETNTELAKRLTDAIQVNAIAANLRTLAPYSTVNNNRTHYIQDLLREAADRLTGNAYVFQLEQRFLKLSKKYRIVIGSLFALLSVIAVETICLIVRH